MSEEFCEAVDWEQMFKLKEESMKEEIHTLRKLLENGGVRLSRREKTQRERFHLESQFSEQQRRLQWEWRQLDEERRISSERSALEEEKILHHQEKEETYYEKWQLDLEKRKRKLDKEQSTQFVEREL